MFLFKATTRVSLRSVLNVQLDAVSVQVVFCAPHVQVDFYSTRVECAQIRVHSGTTQILLFRDARDVRMIA